MMFAIASRVGAQIDVRGGARSWIDWAGHLKESAVIK